MGNKGKSNGNRTEGKGIVSVYFKHEAVEGIDIVLYVKY